MNGNECAKCKKPATMSCGLCKDSPVLPGEPLVPQYCSSACIEANKNHWKVCLRLQDRRTLYRVMTMTQKLFYVYRETTWAEIDVLGVKKIGDSLILRGTVEDGVDWPGPPELYKNFPSHLFPKEEHREAVLSFLGCKNAMIWMAEFAVGMLDGVVKDKRQIVFKTRNDKRQTCIYSSSNLAKAFESDPKGIEHEVLKVTLRSGEKFVVDVSGAQYGYHDPVTRFQEFQQQRVFCIHKDMASPNTHRMIQVNDYSAKTRIAFRKKICMIKPPRTLTMDLLEVMNINMLDWQFYENLSLEDVLRLPEEKFQKKLDDLVDYMHWKMYRPEKKYFTVRGKQLAKDLKEQWVVGKGPWIHGKE